ncbi:hypothetical protein C8J57DRAFT_1302463 [Mycena rebaudengoi]|nr:hypothetical protein C8J57DRAFT_1302463 [Mycena rebaudengoi]
MRPLPSPPVSAASRYSFMWPQDEPTPSTAQTFTLRLPIGAKSPTTAGGGPRPLMKRRRREGRIFTHSASSSVSSFESSSSCSIISADFWMPPQEVITIPMQAAYLEAAPSDTETKIMPPTTPRPKTKVKSKPANIIIPRNAPIAIAASPASLNTPPLSTTLTFPTSSDTASMPQTPRTPLSPLSPQPRVQTPNARIRKIAKLTRTLGENIHWSSCGRSPSGSSPLNNPPLPSSAPCARQAVMVPRVKPSRKVRRMVGRVQKPPAEANGRGTWRKKENTWSGEWNVENMEELQVQLRRLRC